MFKKFWPYLTLLIVVLVFFWQVFIKGLIPIPADTIVGLYHPYRDLYSAKYPNGIPFKNFLITDPVRQEYPWKMVALESLKEFNLFSWNPYSMSGYPGAANFQTGFFYPINLFSFILPFLSFWTLYIIIAPLLAGIFMLLFLRNLKLGNLSSLFGAIIFSFGGFSATWLEWGNILHTSLWLPLILLSIDKVLSGGDSTFKVFTRKLNVNIVWSAVLSFSFISSFFAGHLQTFFYILLISVGYIVFRLNSRVNRKNSLSLLGAFSLFLLITAVQWIPTLRFIHLSARSLDQNFLTTPGWFLPWQNIIQFLVPDFFGNPSTLNYWGVWNYGELTGYAGVASVLFAAIAIFFKRSREVVFFLMLGFISLLFAFPDFIAKIPFMLNLPFISSAQPTRLLFPVGFSLATLAAFGFDYFSNKQKIREIALVIVSFSVLCVLLLVLTMQPGIFGASISDLAVAQRNMVLPVAVFVLVSTLLVVGTRLNKRYLSVILLAIILLTTLDLYRFSWKFNTFSTKQYLYPKTKLLTYLRENTGYYRFSTNDSSVMPPNFSSIYKLYSVDGYDSLYLKRYAEFISALNRGKPDISSPYGFNRIVKVTNYNSNLYDLLGVKYLLSLTDVTHPKFNNVGREGKTRIYENKNVLPRAFLVQEVFASSSKQNTINKMFDKDFDPGNQAIAEDFKDMKFTTQGGVSIISYTQSRVNLQTETDNEGFVVLTDVNYPTWRAQVDGKITKIYQTDYVFRGIVVPRGKHTVTFYNSAL